MIPEDEDWDLDYNKVSSAKSKKANGNRVKGQKEQKEEKKGDDEEIHSLENYIHRPEIFAELLNERDFTPNIKKMMKHKLGEIEYRVRGNNKKAPCTRKEITKGTIGHSNTKRIFVPMNGKIHTVGGLLRGDGCIKTRLKAKDTMGPHIVSAHNVNLRAIRIMQYMGMQRGKSR